MTAGLPWPDDGKYFFVGQQAKLFLNLLLIEDSEDDAFFINDALKRDGYELFCKRVQTAAEMRQALTSQPGTDPFGSSSAWF